MSLSGSPASLLLLLLLVIVLSLALFPAPLLFGVGIGIPTAVAVAVAVAIASAIAMSDTNYQNYCSYHHYDHNNYHHKHHRYYHYTLLSLNGSPAPGSASRRAHPPTLPLLTLLPLYTIVTQRITSSWKCVASRSSAHGMPTVSSTAVTAPTCAAARTS